jgi:hypothetical protein
MVLQKFVLLIGLDGNLSHISVSDLAFGICNCERQFVSSYEGNSVVLPKLSLQPSPW